MGSGPDLRPLDVPLPADLLRSSTRIQRGGTITTEICMFGQLAADGRLRRAVQATRTTPRSDAMVSTSYSIKGMTCGHCADAVTSEHPLDPGAVRDAVDEAGYELAT